MEMLKAKLEMARFLVVGRAGMDLYTDPPGTRTSEVSSFFACLGGSSANMAVALARLGCRADLVTTLSDDAVGWFCLKELDRYGVGRDHVRLVKGEARTSLAIVETRVEDHQSVIYRNNAADFAMSAQDIAPIDINPYGGVLVTGTVFAAEPSRSAGFAMLRKARTAGVPTILDIDYRPYSWSSSEEASRVCMEAARESDIIIGNDDEFAILAGDRDRGLELAEDMAWSGAAIVVYKMGEKGSRTFVADSGFFDTGIFRVEALKPTGAGDSFMGAFIASLSQGLEIKEAVRRGSASAAIVVSNMGCAPAMPDNDAIDVFIRNHPGISAN